MSPSDSARKSSGRTVESSRALRVVEDLLAESAVETLLAAPEGRAGASSSTA